MPDVDMDKLHAIKELMDELVGEMQPGADDFDARLGKSPMDHAGMSPMDGDPDVDQPGEDDGDEGMDMFGSPEDKLKARILKLKG